MCIPLKSVLFLSLFTHAQFIPCELREKEREKVTVRERTRLKKKKKHIDAVGLQRLVSFDCSLLVRVNFKYSNCTTNQKDQTDLSNIIPLSCQNRHLNVSKFLKPKRLRQSTKS